LFKYGHETVSAAPLSGGLATHCVLRPGTSIFPVPEALRDETACPANCATATVMAASRSAGGCEGRTVVVLGAGALGLTATAVASFQGAAAVLVADLDPRRLELAAGFGATVTVDTSDGFGALAKVIERTTQGRGADIVLELSGAWAAVQAALGLCRTGGRLVLVGSVFRSAHVRLDPERVVRGLLSIEGVHNYLPDDLATALNFLASAQDRFPFDSLVEATFSLDDVDTAFHYAAEKRPVRVAVKPFPESHQE